MLEQNREQDLAPISPHIRRIEFLRHVRNAAADWFRDRELPVDPKCPYILADTAQWPENIILEEIVDHILSVQQERVASGEGFALHKYLHHGLSSQALLFNLVGPLIVRHDLAILAELFGQNDGEWLTEAVEAVLEFENRGVLGEGRGQPTSIDMALVDINHRDQPLLFLECKFTEPEFGRCSVASNGGCDGRNPAIDFGLCYLHSIKRLYWPLMAKHGFIDDALQNERLCVMAQHYQFFREVLFAIEYDRPLVLLTDARNPSFGSAAASGGRGLIPLLLSYVPERHRQRILAASIQDVVTRIRESGRHDWIGEFQNKYGVDPA